MDRKEVQELLHRLLAERQTAEKAQHDCSEERLQHLRSRADHFVIMLREAEEDPVDWPPHVLNDAYRALKELEMAQRKEPRLVVKCYPSVHHEQQMYHEITCGDRFSTALSIFWMAIDKSSYGIPH